MFQTRFVKEKDMDRLSTQIEQLAEHGTGGVVKEWAPPTCPR